MKDILTLLSAIAILSLITLASTDFKLPDQNAHVPEFKGRVIVHDVVDDPVISDRLANREFMIACTTVDTHEDLCPHLRAWLERLNSKENP